jgi:hypothetical protein
MKQYNHPKKNTNKIVLRSGSSLNKKWMIYRKRILVENDLTIHNSWKKNLKPKNS